MPVDPVTAYVGLGSNLGERSRFIAQAVAELTRTPTMTQVTLSPLYQTAPWGYADQAPFLNGVARLSVSLEPVQLLLALKRIEQTLGRQPTFRWGPREIDLDLLLYDNQTVEHRGLTVPHPSMHERAFVLAPLRDLWPDYRSPTGEPIDALLARLAADPEQQIARL